MQSYRGQIQPDVGANIVILGITKDAFGAYTWRRLYLFTNSELKNPAYGRQQLSRPMRIIGPIQI